MSFLPKFLPKKFKRTVITGIFQIILILGVGISVSFILFQKINRQCDEFVKKRETIKGIQSLNETEVRLRKDYQEIKDYLDEVIYFLPTDDNVVEIVSSLEKMAQITENAQEIVIGETKPYKDNLKKIDCQIKLSGNLTTFLRYCKQFEKSPYFLNMENIEITGAKGLEKEGNMIFKTSLVVRKK